ncbi:MAG TPA: EAL domain-containing protein [Rhizomicrobium sp.]|nr:EAL domain-containing protein [Rhizomicrobium sp.]
MTRVLITLTALFASATLTAALALFSGWPVAILAGVVAFLASQQVAGTFARLKDKRAHSREITGLRRVTLELDQSLNATRTRIDDLTKEFEAKSQQQGKKIVSELKILEGLMREFAGRVGSRARAAQDTIDPGQVMQTGKPQGSVKAYISSMGSGELLETIRQSLEENRVDLYLQPIVSLPQRKLRYYEALSRLRAEDGSVIMPLQYMKVASPAGLMSVVDNLLLFRCVQVVRRLAQKSRGVGVFCNISADTLTDQEFFPQFLDYMHANKDLGGHIMFEFNQEAVRQAGAEGESNLASLSSMGFGLSMDHVDSLALDFVKLKSLGFRYLKVKADVLLKGMDDAHAPVAAEDFKKLLQRHGMNLIAERVEDEKTVVQLLDYNVDFAQGFLFGEPRAVREDMRPPVDNAPVVSFRKSA